MNLKKIIINNWLLILILAISAFFRFYKISENPPSLNWDEISHGYNAYSILKTGKDEWGQKFPLIFRAYGDYKLPLYIYLTVPFVGIFGLNEFSVRFISVLSGTGLTFLAFLITNKIAKDRKISLLSCLLTAISPWSLFLSRVAVEANLAAFLFAFGIYFFISWLEKERKWQLFLSGVFWGLSLHAYNSTRILVPIFSLMALFFFIKKKILKKNWWFFLILVFFALPLIFQFFDQSGKARYGWVSLIDQGVVNQIIEKRNASSFPIFLTRLIYNRPAYYFYLSVKNYAANLSPKYLFFYGGTHYQFSLPDHELLYFVTVPFLLLGFYQCLKNKNNNFKLIVLWFFLSIIPSAITKDAPHALRTILILPSPMIISAIGLKTLSDFLKDRSRFKGNFLYVIFILAVVFSFGRWWNDYFKIYPKTYSWAWQYGHQEMVNFIKTNYDKYDKIIITKRYGEPHEFLLFYLKYDPQKYQTDKNKKWDYHSNWYWIDGFDKFEFVNDWEVVGGVKCEVGNENCLLISSPGNYPQGWSKIKDINFLDGKPAFEILEN